jgi:hypothetical protein
MHYDAQKASTPPFVSFPVHVFIFTLSGLDDSLRGHFHVEILFTITVICLLDTICI